MASLWETAPLSGIKVVELAGLAPGPFTGMLLADFGATVLRIDRAHADAYSSDGSSQAPTTSDNLIRHKSSVALDLKSPGGLGVLRSILRTADVLIDPYRPGVLESLGLGPASLLALNPGLVVARLTGFRRDGKYSAMAGHDINYLAVSGVLSQLGRDADAPPDFPANLLGDFAGGGLMCATGILFALLARERRRRAGGDGGGGKAAGNPGGGQVVEANMVDGAAYLATFLRLSRKTPLQDGPRGTNLLDGGCPWYDVYETKATTEGRRNQSGGSQDEGPREDGRQYMSVGALEPQFFAALVRGLGLDASWNERRWERERWAELREEMAGRFRSRTRAEWEAVFDGTDACVAPVLSQAELERAGHEQRAAVGLSRTPARPVDQDAAWNPRGLRPGQGGRSIVDEWLGWKEGRDYRVEKGGLVKTGGAKL